MHASYFQVKQNALVWEISHNDLIKKISLYLKDNREFLRFLNKFNQLKFSELEDYQKISYHPGDVSPDW